MKVTYSLSVKRDFGAEEITIGISSDFEITRPDDHNLIFSKLYQGIEERFKHYAAEHLPQVKAPENTPVGQGENRFDIMTVPVTAITREMKDEKFYYKVKCGGWQEHGVRVWDEVLEEAGLLKGENLAPIAKNMKGWFADVKLFNGKPHKVVALHE